jgi:hypothetical protein
VFINSPRMDKDETQRGREAATNRFHHGKLGTDERTSAPLAAQHAGTSAEGTDFTEAPNFDKGQSASLLEQITVAIALPGTASAWASENLRKRTKLES